MSPRETHGAKLERRRVGSGARFPPDASRQERRRISQPDAAVVAFVPGRLLLQAADRQGDPRTARRGTRVPLRAAHRPNFPITSCTTRGPRPNSSVRGIRRSSAKTASTWRFRTTASDPEGMRDRGDRHRPADGPSGCRDQRRPLSDARRRGCARRLALHQHGQDG